MQPLQKQLLRVAIQLDIQPIHAQHVLCLLVRDVRARRVRFPILLEIVHEFHMERPFEHVLRRTLVLDKSEKRHRAKVRLGASQHDGVALRRQQCIVVVAADET